MKRVEVFVLRGGIEAPDAMEFVASVKRVPLPGEPGDAAVERFRVHTMSGIVNGEEEVVNFCITDKFMDQALSAITGQVAGLELGAAHLRWQTRRYESMGFWERVGFLLSPGRTVRRIKEQMKGGAYAD